MAFRRDKAIEAASKFAARGQHDKAAREYQAIVENDPKDIRSWLLLADCLVRTGQAAKAIERYQQVARHYADEGHAQKALAVYRQILNLDPGRLDVQVRCGQLFEKLRQIPDAVATYERAAQAYLRGGNTRDAFSLYAKVADLEPTVVAKRLRLAELYSREQRNAEAVAEFYRAAVTLRDEGKHAEYIRVAERLLYHQKDHDEVQCDLIRAYLDTNEPRRALVKLNALLARTPADPKGLALLAEAFVALGKAEKAVSVVLELVRDQRARGGSGPQTAHVVVRQALTWLPGEPRLQAALGELGAATKSERAADEVAGEPVLDEESVASDEGDDDEFDFGGDEIEELDADEIEEVDSDAIRESEDIADADLDEGEYLDIGGDEAAASPSAPQEVKADGGSSELPDAGDVDLDKQLEEIKVLLKYQLFEHALAHIEGVIASSGSTAVTLEYRARTLAALARADDAATEYVAVATLLFPTDPARARLMLERANEQVPGHAGAQATGARFAAGAQRVETAVEAVEDITFDAPVDEDARDAEVAAATDAFGDFAVDLPAAQGSGDTATPVPIPIPQVDTDVLDRSLGEIAEEPAAVPVGYSALEFDGDIDLAGLDRAEPETSGLDDGETLDMDDPEFDDLEDELDRDAGRAAAGDSGSFAISIHAEEEAEATLEPIAVEDRFGLPDESGRGSRAELAEAIAIVDAGVADDGATTGASEVGAAVDLTEELDEIEFLVSQGFDDDAHDALEELRARHPDHAGILALAERLAVAKAVNEAPTTSLRASAGDASAPLLDVDDDDVEDDGYLAAIFAAKTPETKAAKVQHRARAEVEGADAGTRFDLGMAYREMGLVDDAIKEFEAAAADPRWQARALVMMADMLTHQGRTQDAIARLEQAADSARTGDERSEANYELGVLYGTMGEVEKAVARLKAVAAGYRDVDARLQEYRG